MNECIERLVPYIVLLLLIIFVRIILGSYDVRVKWIIDMRYIVLFHIVGYIVGIKFLTIWAYIVFWIVVGLYLGHIMIYCIYLLSEQKYHIYYIFILVIIMPFQSFYNSFKDVEDILSKNLNIPFQSFIATIF